MKSDWLPTMPLHVAIWSQIVFDSDLSWEDQGRAIRLLANAWSAGELERKAWASDEAWRAASRMWPEMLAARNENIAKRDKLSESGKRGNKIRWRSRGDSPPDSPPESPPESPPDSPGDRIQSRSISSKQEHNQKKDTQSAREARRVSDEVFGKFWAQYPRKENRKDALRAWGKVDVEEWPLVTAGLLRWKASEQWQRGIIPHAATWLNREQWREEPMVRPSAPPSPQPDPSRRNSFVPEHSRQNIPTADETRARIRAEDEERRRQELRAQLRSVS